MLSHFSHVQLFVTLWTVASQAPLSMAFSGQEYWSELPCPPPRDLPNPGIEPESLASPALAGGFFTTMPSRNKGEKHIQEHTHTRTYIYKNIHIQKHTHTRTYTYKNMHIQEHTHTKIYTYKINGKGMDDPQISLFHWLNEKGHQWACSLCIHITSWTLLLYPLVNL